MKRALGLALSAFFLTGSLILPLGDFSFLTSLPSMYGSCKALEDKDMTIVDFVTDHLVNLDGLLDPHDQGDEQRPHSPITYQYAGSVLIMPVKLAFCLNLRTTPSPEGRTIYRARFDIEGFPSGVYHPPCA